jgi:hypothetical protein
VNAAEADVSIEGHIDKVGDSFEARITATAANGTQRGARTLRQSGDCRALDRALAFVVALLIDPDLTLERLPSALVALGAEGAAPEAVLLRELTATPPQPHVLAVAPAPAIKPSPAPKQVAAQRMPRQLQFGAALGVRELPKASLALATSVNALPRRWLALELGLRSAFMLGRAQQQARSFTAQTLSAQLLACPRYPFSRMYLELCLGPDGSLTRAHGNGFSTNKAGYQFAAAALIAGGVGVEVRGDWSLHLRAQTRVLLNSPHFIYDQPDGAHEAFALERVAFGVSIGAGYAL